MDILVPSLGESVAEAIVAKWYKQVGEQIAAEELLLELETDKITLEVNAPASGIISGIKVEEGESVGVGDLLAILEEGEVSAVQESIKPETPQEKIIDQGVTSALSPAVKKLLDEHHLNPDNIKGTGKAGRILKGDVIDYIETSKMQSTTMISHQKTSVSRSEKRVRMSNLRQTIAKRLKHSQNTAAILTTFNEIDMSKVMDIRAKHKDEFQKKYGVRLGFMSFFVKAVTNALHEFPAVNAEIDGNDILYKEYYDIGVAVGTPSGLVVPVVRDAGKLSLAGIEARIGELASRASEGKLSMEELTGGTFTISNGGVYGSLMSTPIINPPQSGILGMHKIEQRPVVVDGEIVIRPMMYVALSYDHRIVDGKDSVSFLVRIKENIEDPTRLLF